MKKFVFLVLLPIATLFVAQSAVAENLQLEFDFDNAPYMGGEADIEAYMEAAIEAQMGDLYPSYDVTVTGGRVGNGYGYFHGPLHNYPGDHYIQAGPNWGIHLVSFTFEELPITAVSFDWAIRFNDFHALADGVEIFSSPGSWDCWASGSFETTFDSPVTTLTFRDSYLGEIEVDNLTVTIPTPEPTTISLFGLGALTFLRKRTAWPKSRTPTRYPAISVKRKHKSC